MEDNTILTLKWLTLLKKLIFSLKLTLYLLIVNYPIFAS